MRIEDMTRKLYNIGLSYKKADVQTRGAFSISKPNQTALLESAKEKGIDGIFVISTCNRTEITGFAKHPFELIQLLCEFSEGSVEDFAKFSNVYKDGEAIDHLFRIGTGLDSQILGDYEIVSQLKQSFMTAKEVGTTNAYLERLLNSVLQASKNVKNNTQISSGTTSVAYAAVQYILENVENLANKNITVFGLGDMGKSTCKNILEYTLNRKIKLINRTESKTEAFVAEHPEISKGNYHDLAEDIKDTDILIVSTGADKPTITKQHLEGHKEMLVMDLSMPENVDISVKELENITLINVDELSKITDRTIEKRRKDIPVAEGIIEEHKTEFLNWLEHRKFTPAVNALKESLRSIQNDELDFQSKKLKDLNLEHAEIITSRLIQKITTQFVKHLKDEDTSMDMSIDVMQKVFNFNTISIDEK
nr:glutamyl-tRNA reductase [Aureivirga sp. CE67]